MSKTFWGVIFVICGIFLGAATIVSQYNLEQVQEFSAMQQESLDRDLETIAYQKIYIAELEECLEFLVPRIVVEPLEE